MLERLGELYLPLIGWTLVGLLFLRWLPARFPKLLAQGLYWVGVPLQVLSFTLRAHLDGTLWCVPLIVVCSLLWGWGWGWWLGRWFAPDQRGSFLLSAVIGNTGFVGLALIPYLLDRSYLAWVVLYSLTHNVVGSYGMGVAIANFYGSNNTPKTWWDHGRAVLLTPAIWAFVVGCLWQVGHWERWLGVVQSDIGILADLVSPIALILVGIRLQSQSSESFWASWKPSLVAALIKVVGLPLSMGLLLKLFVLPKGAVLGMVLQGGMPTALAGIILAETYELPQAQIIALTIAFSSVGMLLTIPVWLWLFG